MTRFPKPPAVKAPTAIASNGREATRAHARLDNVESVQSQQTSQIATGVTNLAAVETRLGGGTHETYLGTLTKMGHIGGAAGGFSHSGIGTISTAPTAAEYNALNTAFNNLVDGVNNLVATFNGLLNELQTSNYQA